MIRNAVIHIANEQPLLADLYKVPTTSDVSLVCTNVRMLDGKKPIFIDQPSSVFVFPYLHVRFIEVPAAALADLPPEAETTGQTERDLILAEASDPTSDGDEDLELDEDFLRRIREA